MRPFPPDHIADPFRIPEAFLPAPEVTAWIRDRLLTPGAPLWNEDHQHLELAVIDVLWTNVIHTRQMRTALASAEVPTPKGTPWVKARQEHQLVQWFGRVPDFLLTFDAVFAAELDHITWCAVVEHELYHCAQSLDGYGSPRWHRDGTPIFGIRGHDVEEFVGVVRRYGTTGAGVEAMVQAASVPPLIAGATIGAACGTCLARAA